MIRKKTMPTNNKEGEAKSKPQKVRNYIYSTGRRKTSVARVRLFQDGEGKIIVNDKNFVIYFPYFEWKDIIISPLKSCGKLNNFNFSIKVCGGGIKSQAEAVRSGISRALIKYDEGLRKTLKPLGFLSVDPRQKERKKPGLKRARRAPQWQKR